MRKEFFISPNSVTIDYRNTFYDLHNNYDFIGIILDHKDKNVLSVFFKKTKGDWAKATDPHMITIIFEGLKFVETSKNFFIENLQRLEDIGYKEPNDFDYDWLGIEEHSNKEKHMVFRFESDEYLRVFSDRVLIEVS